MTLRTIVRRFSLFAFIATIASNSFAQQSRFDQPAPSAETIHKLRSSFDTILPKLRVCTQGIVEGHNKFCNASMLSGIEQHITEEHAVHISVLYEPRPIGGILTVTVNLVPAFAGIGAASRPLLSRSLAQAVDRMTADDIEAVSNKLIGELSEAYAQGSNFKREKSDLGGGSLALESDFRMSPHTHGMETK